jgi:hypothetical protein
VLLQMRRWQKLGTRAGSLALAALLWAALPTTAQADYISYFNGPDGIGFDNSIFEPPMLPSLFVSALETPLGLKIKQKVKKVKKGDGFVEVKIKIKIKNKSDVNLEDLIVLISALEDPFSDTAFQLDLGSGDQLPLEVALNEELARFYAAFVAGDLAPKKKIKEKIYLRAETDSLQKGDLVTLAMASRALVTPEPATALMLGLGLLGLALCGRRPVRVRE